MITGLAAFSLAACAGAAESAPEPQQAAFVPAQPAAPQVEPVVEVVQPAGSTNQVVTETPTEVEPVVSTTFVKWVPEGPPVDNAEGPLAEGAEATLTRMEHGFYATFKTAGLEPGDAYTLWWIIFNQPENCSGGKCGLNDAFVFDENGQRETTETGAPKWNFPAHAATGFALGGAGGTIVDTDGTAEFRAHLPVDDAHEFGFGPGLVNPFTSEVHLVIRTHSQMIPGSLHTQLNSPWGGCPEGFPKDPCRDMQIAIFSPSEQ